MPVAGMLLKVCYCRLIDGEKSLANDMGGHLVCVYVYLYLYPEWHRVFICWCHRHCRHRHDYKWTNGQAFHIVYIWGARTSRVQWTDTFVSSIYIHGNRNYVNIALLFGLFAVNRRKALKKGISYRVRWMKVYAW